VKNKKLTLEELTELYHESPQKFKGYFNKIPIKESICYGLKYLERARKNLSEVNDLIAELKYESKLISFEKNFGYKPEISKN